MISRRALLLGIAEKFSRYETIEFDFMGAHDELLYLSVVARPPVLAECYKIYWGLVNPNWANPLWWTKDRGSWTEQEHFKGLLSLPPYTTHTQNFQAQTEIEGVACHRITFYLSSLRS